MAHPRLDELIEHELTPGLLAKFFDPDGPFDGTTFLDLGSPQDPYRFQVGDIAALTLLDVALRPWAVRRILGLDAELLREQLSAIPDDVDLWDAREEHLEAAERIGITFSSSTPASDGSLRASCWLANVHGWFR